MLSPSEETEAGAMKAAETPASDQAGTGAKPRTSRRRKRRSKRRDGDDLWSLAESPPSPPADWLISQQVGAPAAALQVDEATPLLQRAFRSVRQGW